jgi:hypothetical protein
MNTKPQLLLNRKIEEATAGLTSQYIGRLKNKVSEDNALAISDFILSAKSEINLSDNYRKLIITVLGQLSAFHKQTLFKDLSREDVLSYLNSLRKPEASDPLHGWIGTYNNYLIVIAKFFKWLYHPHIEPKKRPKPNVVENIPKLKRKEESTYKPSDLSRPIPLIDSIPYVKDWLEHGHPHASNSDAIFICGLGKRIGRRILSTSLAGIYSKYKQHFFPRLLENPHILTEDKQKIRELLKKPWNPYIRRHSALTEKSIVLKEHVLRQHAGWSGKSQMHLKYIHYFGNESSESLLQAHGIVAKDQKLIDTLKPKQCPNCNEPNKPDSKFCAKCNMVLTYDAFNETVEEKQEKDKELESFKKRIANMENLLTVIQPFLKQIKPEMLSNLNIIEVKDN